MIGKSNALKDMQNYEAGFVDKASMAIQRDLEEAWARRQAAAIMVMDDAEVVRDGQHAVEALNRDLIRKVGHSNILTVAKLHKQLGPQGRDRLQEAVRASRLGSKMLQAATEYKCSAREQHFSSALACEHHDCVQPGSSCGLLLHTMARHEAFSTGPYGPDFEVRTTCSCPRRTARHRDRFDREHLDPLGRHAILHKDGRQWQSHE